MLARKDFLIIINNIFKNEKNFQDFVLLPSQWRNHSELVELSYLIKNNWTFVRVWVRKFLVKTQKEKWFFEIFGNLWHISVEKSLFEVNLVRRNTNNISNFHGSIRFFLEFKGINPWGCNRLIEVSGLTCGIYAMQIVP